MAYVGILQRQHGDISELVNNIRRLMENGGLEQRAAEAAKQISILAGKLRIHLNTEDQSMYPSLLNSESLELRNMAKRYIEEMGNISKQFTEYKDRYNTRSKILDNTAAFIKETDTVLGMLEARIEKENKMLYPLIQV